MNILLWLAMPVLLSGCITSNTLDAINHPSQRHLPDHIDKVARASLNQSNQLLICFEGRLTNSPRSSPYNMIVPLSDLKLLTRRKAATQSTEAFCWSEVMVKRSQIVDGWPAEASASDAELPVAVGPPFLDGWFTNHVRKASTLKPVPGADRTIYQVFFGRTNTIPYPSHPMLIYVDAKRPETFIDIKLEGVTVMEEHKALVVAMPFAIAADIATLPVQLVFVCIFLCGPHC